MIYLKNTNRSNSRYTEAFRSGYAIKAIPKMARVIGRRTGVDVWPNTTAPMRYENEYGTFAGYWCLLSNGAALRINFLLSTSDYVYSVDYFPDASSVTAEFTVQFKPQDNIIYIINTLEDIVNGEELEIEESRVERKPRMVERKKPAQRAVFAWIEDDKRAKDDIQKRRLSQVYEDFIEWAEDNNRLVVSQPSFNKAVKVYLEDNNLVNKYLRAGKKKKAAKKDNIIVDAAEEAEFEQDLKMTYDEQLDQVRASINILRQGMANGLIVTGPPGIGKSEVVFDELDESGVDYTFVSGEIKNSKELYRYLYTHRQGEFIVLDDVQMSIIKKAREIILAITDMSTKKGHMVSFLDKEFYDPKNWDQLTPKGKERGVPNQFKFTSRIVLITNFGGKKLDSAFKSRAFNVDVDVDTQEIIQKIRDKKSEFFPQYTDEQKDEVIDFLEQNMNVFKTIDYRAYEKALVFRGTGGPQWKKFAFNQIASS